MEKNRLLAALEREYKNEKMKKEQDADFAFRVLLKNNPDFAALETALRSAEIAAAKKQISAADVKKAQTARDGWLKSRGITPESLLPAYDCALCRDSGTVDGTYCSCFTAKLNELLASAEAPDQTNTFKTAGLGKIKNKEQQARLQKIYAAAKDFCEKFPAVTKHNIALVGKTGTGKTYLLSAMVNELESKNFHVLYLSAFALNNLFLKYHTTFDEDKMPYFDLLLNCDILAIDDLGTEPVYKNVTKEYLYSIINERNKKKKSTIFSTNLSPSDIRDHYEDRIAYRLLDKDKTVVIEFTGGDLRIQGE